MTMQIKELDDEEQQRRDMQEAGCVPGDHKGPILIHIRLNREPKVDKVCDACGTAVEGWSYAPPCESIEINLKNGDTETFTRSN